MIKERIPETFQGITGEFVVSDYDSFQRGMRDRAAIPTDKIIEFGIKSGKVLEIGPGPGYLGLEWLKKTTGTEPRTPSRINSGECGTELYWREISEDMRKIAEKNALEYGLTDRINFNVSDATKRFPFKDDYFDAVFTNGSLHEWAKPIEVFNEIQRVLKKGGRFFIGDLKRNINPIIKFVMKSMTKKDSMKKGLISSVNAAYLYGELTELLNESNLENFIIFENFFGLSITGIKN